MFILNCVHLPAQVLPCLCAFCKIRVPSWKSDFQMTFYCFFESSVVSYKFQLSGLNGTLYYSFQNSCCYFFLWNSGVILKNVYASLFKTYLIHSDHGCQAPKNTKKLQAHSTSKHKTNLVPYLNLNINVNEFVSSNGGKGFQQ